MEVANVLSLVRLRTERGEHTRASRRHTVSRKHQRHIPVQEEEVSWPNDNLHNWTKRQGETEEHFRVPLSGNLFLEGGLCTAETFA